MDYNDTTIIELTKRTSAVKNKNSRSEEEEDTATNECCCIHCNVVDNNLGRNASYNRTKNGAVASTGGRKTHLPSCLSPVPFCPIPPLLAQEQEGNVPDDDDDDACSFLLSGTTTTTTGSGGIITSNATKSWRRSTTTSTHHDQYCYMPPAPVVVALLPVVASSSNVVFSSLPICTPALAYMALPRDCWWMGSVQQQEAMPLPLVLPAPLQQCTSHVVGGLMVPSLPLPSGMMPLAPISSSLYPISTATTGGAGSTRTTIRSAAATSSSASTCPSSSSATTILPLLVQQGLSRVVTPERKSTTMNFSDHSPHAPAINVAPRARKREDDGGKNEKKRQKRRKENVLDLLVVDGPTAAAPVPPLPQLTDNNSVCCSWMTMFDRAQKFKEKHGHCWIAMKRETKSDDSWSCSTKTNNDDEDYELGCWARSQRVRHAGLVGRSGCQAEDNMNSNNDDRRLTPERIALLNSIGFIWEYQTMRWWDSYNELLEFQLAMGHTRVPAVYEANQALGSWVRTQRRNAAASKLSPERAEALNRIGFEYHLKPGRTRR
jgi:Helicase associated domain